MSRSMPLRPSLPNFVHSLLTISTIQLARAAGFNRGDSTSVNALAATAASFIVEIGAMAKSFAELSGRQTPNAADVAEAIEDYGESINELREFLSRSDSLPFFHPALPEFPIVRPIVKVQPSPIAAMDGSDQQKLPPHIPDYFPPFPDLVTFHSSPAPPDNSRDADSLRKRKFEQSRAVEQGLVKIQAAQEEKQSPVKKTNYFGSLTQIESQSGHGNLRAGDNDSRHMEMADSVEDDNPFTRPPEEPELESSSQLLSHSSLAMSQSSSQPASARPTPAQSPPDLTSESPLSIEPTPVRNYLNDQSPSPIQDPDGETDADADADAEIEIEI